MLSDLLEQAIDSDPRFLAARYQYESTQHARIAVRSRLLPSLGLTYESTDTSQDIVRSDNSVFGAGQSSFGTTNLSITLRQPIFRWDLIQANQQARAAERQAAQEFAAQEQALILRLTESYLNALAARDGLELARAERESIESNLRLVEARRASGLADRMDLHDAQARASVAEVQELVAMNELADSRMALAEMVGQVPGSLDSLASEIPLDLPDPADQQAWVDAAMADNLQLRAAAEAIEVATREVSARQGGHYPSLELIYSDSDNDTDGSLFGGGSQVASTDVMLLLTVPIYEGGGTQAGVREAASLLSRTQEERNLLQRQLAREARDAFNGSVTGVRMVESLRESMVAQTAAVDAKERGYRAGLNTVLDILDAQRDLYRIRREYAQARYDYLIDTLRLKQAAGRLSETDLAAVDSLLTSSAAAQPDAGTSD
jgi:outer membrane protein